MLLVALKFIRYDKSKSIGIVIGIVISIFLIGQQVGILNFLTGLMGGIVENSRKDIAQVWIVDNITENANELTSINANIVREVRSVEGVEDAYPIVVANATIKFANGKSGAVLIIGSEEPLFVAGPKQDKIINGSLNSLAQDASITADFFDEKIFSNSLKVGTRVELNGKEAFIKVQTKNARSFAGAIIYTSLSKARFYTDFPENKVSAIGIKLKDSVNTEEIISKINNTLYGVKAWDAEILKNKTIAFITISSNIGTSIGSLIIFAIISGFFIIGLTLYSAALDRLKDYGTLKAIGATNSYIKRLILTQATLFALIGFSIALLLLESFRNGVQSAGLVFSYSITVYFGLFLITLLISVGGSLFAIRRIVKLEPAAVFRA